MKDAFKALAGGPGITFKMEDFKPDLKRGAGASHERFDVFWKMLDEANKKGWVTTCTTPKMPEEMLEESEEIQRWASIDGKGLRYNHTYTILDARTVKLKNDYTDIIALLRNPSGKTCKGA